LQQTAAIRNLGQAHKVFPKLTAAARGKRKIRGKGEGRKEGRRKEGRIKEEGGGGGGGE